MGVTTMISEKQSIPVKRSTRSYSYNMKLRTDEWLLSDVPSDVAVEAGGITFALHKFPLVSRSGRIRKLLTEAAARDTKLIRLQDIPGGADAFELATKFCYGVNVEISAANVAMLRCAASYLEMTENYGEGSLESLTEAYLNEIVIQNLANSVTVLHSCESLLPFAEELKIISRCIDGITSKACRDDQQIQSALSRLKYSVSPHMESDLNQMNLSFSTDIINRVHQIKPNLADWNSWGKELKILNIHMFQRVLTALKSKDLINQEIISGALMHYAQNSLEGFQNVIRDPHLCRAKLKIRDAVPPTVLEREQRSVIETVVSLLPIQGKNNSIPVSFLSGLLRSAIMLNTTTSCRMELERRIGIKLDEATLDDILIPTSSYSIEDTLLDTDVVHRIFTNFLQSEAEELARAGYMMPHAEIITSATAIPYESDGMGSPKQSAAVKVSNLMDSYLAEIGPDSSLSASKFIALAEIMPDHVRAVDDGLYRAIDIFLKAHPTIRETERNKVCKVMDCQKLSHEACTHAAQNERLPVQLAVQVLYFEQLRLRNAMNGNADFAAAQRLNSGAPSAAISPRDNYASVRRENRELKLEVARMRMRLSDLERDHVSMKQDLLRSTPTHKFLHSFSKKLAKFNSLFRPKDHNNMLLISATASASANACGKTPPVDAPHLISVSRRRRHSIS